MIVWDRLGAEGGPSIRLVRLLSRFLSSRLIESPCPSSSPGPRPRSAEHQQVIGDHAEPHPALHPREAAIPAASKAVPALQGADAPFTAGPPFERGSNGARTPLPALPQQDHGPHAARICRVLIGPGGEAAIRHGQTRGATDQLLVPDQRGHPQRVVRHAGLADSRTPSRKASTPRSRPSRRWPTASGTESASRQLSTSTAAALTSTRLPTENPEEPLTESRIIQ